jgi:cyclopropane fatty-acyl-phospholipid synthase-like methyltransferase
VKHVYGIDMSSVILAKAVRHLAERSIINFTPILADRYKTDIPDGIDLVFSIVVMQHLTRDLVADYFGSLAKNLSAEVPCSSNFWKTVATGNRPMRN